MLISVSLVRLEAELIIQGYIGLDTMSIRVAVWYKITILCTMSFPYGHSNTLSTMIKYLPFAT